MLSKKRIPLLPFLKNSEKKRNFYLAYTEQTEYVLRILFNNKIYTESYKSIIRTLYCKDIRRVRAY